MKLSSTIVLAAALAPIPAAGAEYHIYKNAAGAIVLSNVPAAQVRTDGARESLTLVKSYDMSETTAEEIAATEKENRETARIGVLRDLAVQTERLADEVQRLNDATLASLRSSAEINQVIVNQGFGRLRFRHR
jgi:hypothetical protein